MWPFKRKREPDEAQGPEHSSGASGAGRAMGEGRPFPKGEEPAEPMATSDAAPRLKALLVGAGIRGRQPSPQEMWRVFKSFAAEPVECEDDFVMIQVGDSDVMGESYLDFCREFSVGGGETEQVHAEFKVVLPKRLGCKQTDCSSCDFADLETFFAEVEKMPGFQAGLAYPDWVFSIYHTEV